MVAVLELLMVALLFCVVVGLSSPRGDFLCVATATAHWKGNGYVRDLLVVFQRVETRPLGSVPTKE